MILPGVALNRDLQKKSLQWIREQSLDENCVASFATHDTDVKPQIVEW